MVERAGTWLLLDETYRELGDESPPARLSPQRPGDQRLLPLEDLRRARHPGRLGYLPQPRLDDHPPRRPGTGRPRPIRSSTSPSPNMSSRSRDRLLPEIRAHIVGQRQIMSNWIAGDDRVEWVEPQGGVVCFPRFADPDIDARRIYAQLQNDGIFLGPGWWFEQEPRHMRLGFGYPTATELKTALTEISETLDTR